MQQKTLIQGLEAIKGGMSTVSLAPSQSFEVLFADDVLVPDVRLMGDDGRVSWVSPSNETDKQAVAKNKLMDAIAVFKDVLGDSNVELSVTQKFPELSAPVDKTNTSVGDVLEQQSIEYERDQQECTLSLRTPHGLSIRDLFKMKRIHITGLVEEIVAATERAVQKRKRPAERVLASSSSSIVDYAIRNDAENTCVVNVKDIDIANALLDKLGLFGTSDGEHAVFISVKKGPGRDQIEMVLPNTVTEVPRHIVQVRMDKAIAALKDWSIDKEGNFVSGTFEDITQAVAVGSILRGIAEDRQHQGMDITISTDYAAVQRVVIRPSQYKNLSQNSVGGAIVGEFRSATDGEISSYLDTIQQFIQEEVGGTVQRGRSPS